MAVAASSPRVSLVLKADLREGHTDALRAKVEAEGPVAAAAAPAAEAAEADEDTAEAPAAEASAEAPVAEATADVAEGGDELVVLIEHQDLPAKIGRRRRRRQRQLLTDEFFGRILAMRPAI